MDGRGCGAIWLRRALALAALVARPALAGEWHTGAALACSDCHTMHNSRNGQPMRYDASESPANLLLRAESATALCLACHGGGSPASSAPSVASPSSWDPPGGGFPVDLSDPSHLAHALGPAPALPPDGTAEVVVTCVTCHAPHGNGNYRNLIASPSGRNRATAAPVVAQLTTANGSNAASVYVRSNVKYVSGWSAWCMDCHDALPAVHASMGHPWDVAVSGPDTWPAWSREPMENRVPVENARGLAVAQPNDGDRVFCLSCHKAHGSPNPSAMIHADGTTQTSTCQQCHDM
jgi:predicted CXXCH cytochrome family protein